MVFDWALNFLHKTKVKKLLNRIENFTLKYSRIMQKMRGNKINQQTTLIYFRTVTATKRPQTKQNWQCFGFYFRYWHRKCNSNCRTTFLLLFRLYVCLFACSNNLKQQKNFQLMHFNCGSPIKLYIFFRCQLAKGVNNFSN